MSSPDGNPIPMPGGQMSTRPLHFIWILDCSGSMAANGKIEALNNAIREAIPNMRDVADDHPNAQILVRVVKFSDTAEWQVRQATPVEDFRWVDLAAGGVTAMGKALKMVAEELDVSRMPQRALPPVLALVSDGQPTDEFDAGLRELMKQPWGKKAVRIAISIGVDADDECLQKFIGHSELKPLRANNPEMLVKHIRWVSTVVTQSVTAPASSVAGSGIKTPNVVLPNTPVDEPDAATVW